MRILVFHELQFNHDSFFPQEIQDRLLPLSLGKHQRPLMKYCRRGAWLTLLLRMELIASVPTWLISGTHVATAPPRSTADQSL